MAAALVAAKLALQDTLALEVYDGGIAIEVVPRIDGPKLQKDAIQVEIHLFLDPFGNDHQTCFDNGVSSPRAHLAHDRQHMDNSIDRCNFCCMILLPQRLWAVLGHTLSMVISKVSQ